MHEGLNQIPVPGLHSRLNIPTHIGRRHWRWRIALELVDYEVVPGPEEFIGPSRLPPRDCVSSHDPSRDCDLTCEGERYSTCIPVNSSPLVTEVIAPTRVPNNPPNKEPLLRVER